MVMMMMMMMTEQDSGYSLGQRRQVPHLQFRSAVLHVTSQADHEWQTLLVHDKLT
jgi:hypothetical protein